MAQAKSRDIILDRENIKDRIAETVDVLIETNEILKSDMELTRAEREKLSEALSGRIDDLFLYLGVHPKALKECYRLTKYHLEQQRKRVMA